MTSNTTHPELHTVACLGCGYRTHDAMTMAVWNDQTGACPECGSESTQWLLTDGSTTTTGPAIPPLPKVQQVLAALKADGWVNAEWAHTGGGCRAIRVPLGNPAQQDWREVMVTGGDVFSAADLTTDAHLDGEWYVGGYDGSGDHQVEALLPEADYAWQALLDNLVEAVNVAALATLHPRMAYAAMVRAFGGGFHPDTDPAAYEHPMPTGYGPHMVASVMAYAEGQGVDLYHTALEVLTVMESPVCVWCGEGDVAEVGAVVRGLHAGTCVEAWQTEGVVLPEGVQA